MALVRTERHSFFVAVVKHGWVGRRPLGKMVRAKLEKLDCDSVTRTNREREREKER